MNCATSSSAIPEATKQRRHERGCEKQRPPRRELARAIKSARPHIVVSASGSTCMPSVEGSPPVSPTL